MTQAAKTVAPNRKSRFSTELMPPKNIKPLPENWKKSVYMYNPVWKYVIESGKTGFLPQNEPSKMVTDKNLCHFLEGIVVSCKAEGSMIIYRIFTVFGIIPIITPNIILQYKVTIFIPYSMVEK